MNIAEFDEGIFGIEEAGQKLFGMSSSKLSLQQAALLAAVLPNPKQRSVIDPVSYTHLRAHET